MAAFKSVFITVYISWLFGISGWAIWQVIEHDGSYSTLGLLLLNLPLVVMISRAMLLRDVSRTSANLYLVLAFGVTGWLVALLDVTFADVPSTTQLLMASASLLALLIYVFWYSRFQRQSSVNIQSHQPLPAFTLQNLAGDLIPSTQLLLQPCLMVFYRGNWCPFCVAQIKEICQQYNQLADLGVRVIFVSPQPLNEHQKLKEKFAMQVEFLRDVDNQAAQTLAIKQSFAVPAGMQALGYDSDGPLPTVILTDSQGRVIYKNETDNYRVRPEPAVFIAIAKQYLR